MLCCVVLCCVVLYERVGEVNKHEENKHLYKRQIPGVGKKSKIARKPKRTLWTSMVLQKYVIDLDCQQKQNIRHL